MRYLVMRYLVKGTKEGITIKGRDAIGVTEEYIIKWESWGEEKYTEKRNFYRQREKLIKTLKVEIATETIQEIRFYLKGIFTGSKIDIMEHIGITRIHEELKTAEKIITELIKQGLYIGDM